MKKLMMILIAVPICAFAGPDDTNEVCRRNTLVMAVLQKDTNGTVDTDALNTVDKKWVVKFDYDIFAGAHQYVVKKIKGSATCNEINQKSSKDGKTAEGGIANPGDVNTFLKASPMDVGVNCWCKMDGPVTSWWTYFKSYGTMGDEVARDECAQNCTQYCADKFATNGEIASGVLGRDAMFYTIW